MVYLGAAAEGFSVDRMAVVVSSAVRTAAVVSSVGRTTAVDCSARRTTAADSSEVRAFSVDLVDKPLVHQLPQPTMTFSGYSTYSNPQHQLRPQQTIIYSTFSIYSDLKQPPLRLQDWVACLVFSISSHLHRRCWQQRPNQRQLRLRRHQLTTFSVC